MCGATGDQTKLEGAQLEAYTQAQQMTKEEYGDQQAIYGPMAAQFKSILSAGPNQEGFSAGETEDLNAQAVEGTAENYKAAAKALGESQAAEGGGSIPMPSGAQEAQRAQLAESAAGQESGEEAQIKGASYQQGLNEWQAAAGGLESIAAGENPIGAESAATGAGSAAGTTADSIAAENNSWINAALGAAGSVAGAASGAAIKKWG
jgi:hypothetical protein